MSSPRTSPLMVRAARPNQRPRSRSGVVPSVVMVIGMSSSRWSSRMINRATRKIKRLQLLARIVLLAANLGACGGSVIHGDLPGLPHVFVIVMENRTVAEALGGPFTASLASQHGVASNYRAITHPSGPNYLAVTSGSTWGITDDSYHVLPKQDLGTQLTTAGITWRAYMEGLGDGGCLNSPVPYDPGHNPFAFYGGRWSFHQGDCSP